MRKGNPYSIGLRDSTHRTIVQTRRVYRETDDAACDAAMRWLRMHRNTLGANAVYDAWFCSRLVGPKFLPRRIAEGTLNVGRTDPPRDRENVHRPIAGTASNGDGGVPPRGRVSLPFQQ